MATQWAEPGEQPRGFGIFYRPDADNHCPGCGQRQWLVGRVTAECAFCHTAIAIEQSERVGAPVFRTTGTPDAYAPRRAA